MQDFFVLQYVYIFCYLMSSKNQLYMSKKKAKYQICIKMKLFNPFRLINLGFPARDSR